MTSYYDHKPYHASSTGSSKSAESLQKEYDAQAAASFLLTLKHRSVTPEPQPQHEVQERQQLQQPKPQLATSQSWRGVYAYPPTSFEAPSSGGSTYLERPPSLMEEPSQVVSTDLPWDVLLSESKLVFLKDRDLVPDALFVAMAQMKVCKLTQADRVGCYKTREMGFTGMCCKHCGGQPGFGRYYPNSVRSLAQTTTSQTILKHVGSKCRFCPPHIRQAVLELQRQQAAKEGIASGRPRYGSRKIFFQRIWARLHGKRTGESEDDDKVGSMDNSSQAGTSDDSDHNNERESGSDESDDESLEPKHTKQVSRFAGTSKAKRKHMEQDRDTKRPRTLSS